MEHLVGVLLFRSVHQTSQDQTYPATQWAPKSHQLFSGSTLAGAKESKNWKCCRDNKFRKRIHEIYSSVTFRHASGHTQ